jgi:hypothetical protein
MPATDGKIDCPSFHSRYVAGEHRQVWQELTTLGGKAISPPLIADALAVAREIIRRARHNLSLVHDRLCIEGYRFANPGQALVTRPPASALHVDEMEAKFGKFPLLIRAWYTEIESVDFTQDPTQLSASSRSDVSGLGYGTPVIMQSLDRCWDRWIEISQPTIDGVAHESRSSEPGIGPASSQRSQFRSFLATGAYASNCEPKGFRLPCNAVDAVFFNDGAGDSYFVDELRMWFRWGGFPRSARYLSGFPVLPSYARPNVERLIPMLREGLYEL